MAHLRWLAPVLLVAVSGCSDEVDTTAGATCGNGVSEAPELCDGDCPTTCADSDACTPTSLVGTDCSRQCVSTPITTCQDGDGCCPASCTGASDSDCSAGCGDDVCDAVETCESCPADCGACGTCSDGVQNQNETGIDCGGPCIDCVEAADYYVAPTGDDDAAGTIDSSPARPRPT